MVFPVRLYSPSLACICFALFLALPAAAYTVGGAPGYYAINQAYGGAYAGYRGYANNDGYTDYTSYRYYTTPPYLRSAYKTRFDDPYPSYPGPYDRGTGYYSYAIPSTSVYINGQRVSSYSTAPAYASAGYSNYNYYAGSGYGGAGYYPGNRYGNRYLGYRDNSDVYFAGYTPWGTNVYRLAQSPRVNRVTLGTPPFYY